MKTISKKIAALACAVCILGSSMALMPSETVSAVVTQTHNFTADGSLSSSFDIAGSVQSDKGTVSYDNMTMDTCLKLDTKGSLTFRTDSAATVKVVTKAKIDDASILLNGESVGDLSGLSVSGNTRTFTVPSAGTYTLSKGTGETYIYYIEVTGGASSGDVTQVPSQTQQPSVSQPSSSDVTATDVIFCSPSASSGGAGTYDDPVSVESALTKVKPGGVIWLKGGQYKFSKTINIAESNSGKSGAYKTIAAVPGEDVTFDFSALSVSDSSRGIVLEGSWWHFYGIRIQKAGDNGMLLAGDNNIIEMCIFANNQDTGLQISRINGNYSSIDQWPTNNYIKNCTAMNNCDDATMENADGFAAKLTCGKGNVFDGCMSYNNSDDGWDLYAKEATGPIGIVNIKNSVAFRNGFTEDGRGYGDCDGNGFKLGGGGVGSAHVVDNCIAFENFHCGFTDNNNPLLGSVTNCTAYKNALDQKANFMVYRCTQTNTAFKNLLSYTGGNSKCSNDKFVGTISNSVIYSSGSYYKIGSASAVSNNAPGSVTKAPSDSDFVSVKAPAQGSDFHKIWRNADGSINTQGFLQLNQNSALSGTGVSMTGLTVQKSTPLPQYSVPSAPVTTQAPATATPVTTTTTTVTQPPQTTPVSTTAVPETKVSYGDIDTSGEVDLSDLTLLSQYLLKDVKFDSEQMKSADVNGDGEVDIRDIAVLKQYVMNDPITLGPVE